MDSFAGVGDETLGFVGHIRLRGVQVLAADGFEVFLGGSEVRVDLLLRCRGFGRTLLRTNEWTVL